jgi:hypothetical protein
MSIDGMNEPPPHRQQGMLQFFENTGQLQRMDATIRQGQIDGAAGIRGAPARIGTSFIEFYGISPTL